jgi:hypothetical protein
MEQDQLCCVGLSCFDIYASFVHAAILEDYQTPEHFELLLSKCETILNAFIHHVEIQALDKKLTHKLLRIKTCVCEVKREEAFPPEIPLQKAINKTKKLINNIETPNITNLIQHTLPREIKDRLDFLKYSRNREILKNFVKLKFTISELQSSKKVNFHHFPFAIKFLEPTFLLQQIDDIGLEFLQPSVQMFLSKPVVRDPLRGLSQKQIYNLDINKTPTDRVRAIQLHNFSDSQIRSLDLSRWTDNSIDNLIRSLEKSRYHLLNRRTIKPAARYTADQVLNS